jgi:hypothetical protein
VVLVFAGQRIQVLRQFLEAIAARMERAAHTGLFETPLGVHSYQHKRAGPHNQRLHRYGSVVRYLSGASSQANRAVV